MTQRLFAALRPPPEACDDLARALAAQPPGLRFVPPDRWHVTLAFCGAVPDPGADALLVALAAVAAAHDPLSLRVAGAGAFPRPTRATVLWAGVGPARGRRPERLTELAAAVRDAFRCAGAAPEQRPFAAHLTLARLRRPQDVSPRIWGLDAYAGPPWEADEIVLVRSRPGAGARGGMLHEQLAAFPLGSG